MNRKDLTESQRQEVKDLYGKGMSARAVGELIGLSKDAVYRLLREMNVAGRGYAKRASHGMWKGGRTVTQEGYVKVLLHRDDPFYQHTQGQGYMLEHRYVLAKHLGRALTRNETVHHMNGNVQDNRIENLQLMVGRHGKGSSFCCSECGSTNLKPMEITK